MLTPPSLWRQAPLLLEGEYPELAANISAALAALQAIEPPSHAGLSPRPASSLGAPFACGGLELQIGSHGGLVSLKRGGRQWAGPANPVGQFLYETYIQADYTTFLHDLGSRLGDKGVWPHHTAGPSSILVPFRSLLLIS